MIEKEVIYVADPMCSWCYGFAPVMEHIESAYAGQVSVTLMMAGLYAGNAARLTSGQRSWVLHHWEDVHQVTGQPFFYAQALPDGFVYNTEPACRAVIAMRRLAPASEKDYFKRLQQAFYVENRDTTQQEVLLDEAKAFVPDSDAFAHALAEDETTTDTNEDFRMRHRHGIDGLPGVLLSDRRGYRRLTEGYRPFAELQERFETWLAR